MENINLLKKKKNFLVLTFLWSLQEVDRKWLNLKIQQPIS